METKILQQMMELRCAEGRVQSEIPEIACNDFNSCD